MTKVGVDERRIRGRDFSAVAHDGTLGPASQFAHYLVRGPGPGKSGTDEDIGQLIQHRALSRLNGRLRQILVLEVDNVLRQFARYRPLRHNSSHAASAAFLSWHSDAAF